jgi:putative NIF3 family GTP cyclohydrolase 1 type 2
MIGSLPNALSAEAFFDHLKLQMNLTVLKRTQLINRPIQRVAVCGGAGIFLLNDAKKAGADAFVTSDIKYHEFFDAEGQLILCDIGHYESEIFTKDLIAEFLSQNFPNIALYLTKVVTNPTSYR